MEKIMKNYIFITEEGHTYQPNSESEILDIENMQVIGFSKGSNSTEAFEALKKENPYLLKTSFDEVFAYEVSNKKYTKYYFKS